MTFIEIISWLIIIYAVTYTTSKIFFAVVSIIQIKIYSKLYPHVATEEDLDRHLAIKKKQLPKITVINPAFNEETTIVDSVRSFLRQTYKRTEVIVVNDGSTDQTLAELTRAFDLEPLKDNFHHSERISHEPVRQYYQSRIYRNLIVIDKENGGKADAVNAGVAISDADIVTVIDADSVLESNALIHIADIFEQDPKVAAIGTPIGIVNNSNIGPDGVEDASFPKSFLAKNQVIEYLRSFLLARMAIQKFRGLMIISGAFGIFQKWVLEAIGGYQKGSLAEDMDILTRIWRFLDHNRIKYSIKYIPEVFCWTQVPDSLRGLRIQRDRWSRGMTDSLIKYRKLFFNRKYKLLGLFSYPYYVFFEWLTPFIEVAGILLIVPAILAGRIDMIFIAQIFVIYYSVAVVINLTTVFVESTTGGHYKSNKVVPKLVIIALVEPLFYHWLNSFIYVYGNLRLLFQKERGWGKLDRKKLQRVETPRSGEGEDNHRERNVMAILLLLFITIFSLPAIVPAPDTRDTEPPAHIRKATILAESITIPPTGKVEPLSIPELSEHYSYNEEGESGDVVSFSHQETIEKPDPEVPTGNYYIVVASSKVENVVRSIAEQGEYPHVYIIPPCDELQRYRLAISRNKNLADTRHQLKILLERYGEQLWILRY